jgi:hypothetical protein
MITHLLNIYIIFFLQTHSFHTYSNQILSKKNETSKFSCYVFYNTECSICQFYLPKMMEVHQLCQQHHIDFHLVFSGEFKNQDIMMFMKEYKLDLPYITDRNFELAKELKARVSPEVFIVSNEEGRQVLYSGAVSNDFIRLGKRNRGKVDNYFKEAIIKVLSNQEIKNKRVDPVGCYLEY